MHKEEVDVSVLTESIRVHTVRLTVVFQKNQLRRPYSKMPVLDCLKCHLKVKGKLEGYKPLSSN